jgi:hypothetical protein
MRPRHLTLCPAFNLSCCARRDGRIDRKELRSLLEAAGSGSVSQHLIQVGQEQHGSAAGTGTAAAGVCGTLRLASDRTPCQSQLPAAAANGAGCCVRPLCSQFMGSAPCMCTEAVTEVDGGVKGGKGEGRAPMFASPHMVMRLLSCSKTSRRQGGPPLPAHAAPCLLVNEVTKVTAGPY